MRADRQARRPRGVPRAALRERGAGASALGGPGEVAAALVVGAESFNNRLRGVAGGAAVGERQADGAPCDRAQPDGAAGGRRRGRAPTRSSFHSIPSIPSNPSIHSIPLLVYPLDPLLVGRSIPFIHSIPSGCCPSSIPPFHSMQIIGVPWPTIPWSVHSISSVRSGAPFLIPWSNGSRPPAVSRPTRVRFPSGSLFSASLVPRVQRFRMADCPISSAYGFDLRWDRLPIPLMALPSNGAGIGGFSPRGHRVFDSRQGYASLRRCGRDVTAAVQSATLSVWVQLPSPAPLSRHPVVCEASSR